MNALQIAIINRSTFARESMAKLLDEDDRLSVCSHHASVEGALPDILTSEPDVVVLELADARDCRAISTLRAVREDMAVVVSGIPLNEEVIVSCAKAGASGYIPFDATGRDWANAISAAARGHVADAAIAGILNRYVGRRLGEAPTDSWRVSTEVEASANRVGLTARERQILALVDQGLSTKHIARKLGRSPATVKAHIQAVLAKYNVHRRTEAAAIYRKSKDGPNAARIITPSRKDYSRG